jgi:hypothetical protein
MFKITCSNLSYSVDTLQNIAWAYLQAEENEAASFDTCRMLWMYHVPSIVCGNHPHWRKCYSDNAVSSKYCCDNSKHIFAETQFLNKQSVAKKNLQREYHCYATTENRISMEVVWQNTVTRLKKKVFTIRAERIYLRTDTGALTHRKMNTRTHAHAHTHTERERERERSSSTGLSTTSNLQPSNLQLKFVCMFRITTINIYIKV